MSVNKLIYTGIILLFAFALNWLLKYKLHKGLRKYGLRATQEKLLGRFYVLITGAIVVIGVISVWGVELQDLWLFLTSVIGLVAIGFVAMWSILANILSGWVLLTSHNYKINNRITILDDEIQGTIKDITLMFTVLEDKKGNKINVPNNLMMQKIIKVNQD
jgi:small-conductance mechanosensitive channel